MRVKKYSKTTKQKARILRKRNGLSYKEISDNLGIAKSTAKLWCEDIELSIRQRKRLYTKQIGILNTGPHSSHERRKREVEIILKNSEKEINFPINSTYLKLIGASLYWAEGDKTKHFAIINSDPFLVKFIVVWLKKTLGVEPERLKAHLNIYPQQNEKEIIKFWADLTRIPLKNFGKSFVKPVNKNYKKNILYYGTIKIRVSKGTDLKYKVFGWINALLKNIRTDVNSTERKWHKLKTDYLRP